MNKYILSFLFLFSLEIISEDVTSVNIGEEWFLNSRSNNLSPTNSKVLYFMPNDAYHTYRARQFGDWDVFSIVDDRNLERLNKGDVIQILEPSFNKKIYKVKLMNGSSKNKDFFIITEDLIKYYMPLKEQNNE